MPSCAGFHEPRKSRLRPSKSTFNAKNFICSLSMTISIGFRAVHSWKVSRSPKSPKIHKNPYLNAQGHPRSLKSVAIESKRKTSYQWLIVNQALSCNVTKIQRLIGQKLQILPTCLSFNDLVQGDPLRIYGKVLWFLKLESSGQPTVKIW